MASLTRTAVVARKVIRYTLYGIFIIVTTRYVLITGTRVYRYFFPEPPPPPDTKYALSKIPFPDKAVPDYENLTFVLETAEGSLPELPVQAKVYFMPKSSSNIRVLEDAKQKAKALGFNPDGKEISETVYLFEHNTAPATLEMNIVTNVFSVSYDLRANPSVYSGSPPAPATAISQAKSYFSRPKLLAKDISGPATHEFIKIIGGQFTQAISLSEANLIKVNLFRKSYDEYPSLPPNPNKANIWVIIGSAKGQDSTTLAAEYHYFPIDENEFSTYPLKTASEVWEDLKNGKGFIAKLGQGTEGVVKIRRIYLAYYDAGVYTEFYQPIVVFEGDNDFTAYVQAIPDLYYTKDIQPTTQEINP